MEYSLLLVFHRCITDCLQLCSFKEHSWSHSSVAQTLRYGKSVFPAHTLTSEESKQGICLGFWFSSGACPDSQVGVRIHFPVAIALNSSSCELSARGFSQFLATTSHSLPQDVQEQSKGCMPAYFQRTSIYIWLLLPLARKYSLLITAIILWSAILR